MKLCKVIMANLLKSTLMAFPGRAGCKGGKRNKQNKTKQTNASTDPNSVCYLAAIYLWQMVATLPTTPSLQKENKNE